MWDVIWLLVGLVIIVKSADVLIDSSTKIAKLLGISKFIIGITVVAFGTSAPELAVGVISGMKHSNQLSLGNIIGSSFANLALILGIASIIVPIAVNDRVLKREIPLLIAVELLLAFLMFNDGHLSSAEGAILFLGFMLFMVYITKDARSSETIAFDEEGEIDTVKLDTHLPDRIDSKIPRKDFVLLWIYTLVSLAGLFFGGDLVVDKSTAIAQSIGLSETTIGISVIALATTLPELTAAVFAARRNEPEIVMGNCIGSNIFNILLVLGTSSVLNPIAVDAWLWLDACIMLALTVMVWLLSSYHKTLSRANGIILIIFYFSYMLFKLAYLA